jgi:hypothetical protein
MGHKNNGSNSGYSSHILNMGHSNGNVVDKIKIITIERRGKHLNTLQVYHIYRDSREEMYLSDIYRETHDPIFKIVQKMKARQQYALYKNMT